MYIKIHFILDVLIQRREDWLITFYTFLVKISLMWISFGVSKDARNRNRNKNYQNKHVILYKIRLSFTKISSQTKYSIRIVRSSLWTGCWPYRSPCGQFSFRHRNWSLPFIIRSSDRRAWSGRMSAKYFVVAFIVKLREANAEVPIHNLLYICDEWFACRPFFLSHRSFSSFFFFYLFVKLYFAVFVGV